MSDKAQIIIDPFDGGFHNNGDSAQRVKDKGLYQDQSTICLIPTRGVISARVVQSWWNLMAPMNQRFIRMFVVKMEVGSAYSTAIEQILNTPGLSDFRYILTLEEDNIPPPDGLLRLIERMNEHPEYSAIGGLYWTKGAEGQPMIYGNPAEMPFNFRPQPPVPNELVECNGLGMGFTLFRTDVFKDERIPRPWFETIQRYHPTEGSAAYTQDLYFFENAKKFGHRFACDCGVLVGHYDYENDIVW